MRRCCTSTKALVCVPGDKPKVERSSSFTPDSVTECCRVWTLPVDEIETLFSYFIEEFMDNGCLPALYSRLPVKINRRRQVMATSRRHYSTGTATRTNQLSTSS